MAEEVLNSAKMIIGDSIDLLGGTPCNAALLVANNDSRIKIISGLNLGMVIESAFLDTKELAAKLEKIGKDNISMVEQNASLLSDDE